MVKEELDDEVELEPTPPRHGREYHREQVVTPKIQQASLRLYSRAIKAGSCVPKLALCVTGVAGCAERRAARTGEGFQN